MHWVLREQIKLLDFESNHAKAVQRTAFVAARL